jgi:S1-C subfamily serine protease
VTPLVSVDVAAEIAPVVDPVQIPDETASQARASEALLDGGQRMDLQTALQWAGFYDAAIDGAFGRGTRASMRAWQQANNYVPTGILTTNQRTALLAAYNAVLDGMNLQLVRDDAAGIEMLVPTGVVAFDAYEPPFVRFEAKGEIDAKVLFISQAGDQNRLYGLYEILQTLTIIPPDGGRKRSANSFEIEGIGDGIHSYTYAAVKDGAIKGFSLVWPQGDEARRSRILAEMQNSFTIVDGLLDPAMIAPSDDQSIDMISGLEVRQPKLSRSGFFVDTKGAVLTTFDGLDICEKITINSAHDAEIIASDAGLGIAVLQPKERLSPLSVATFQTGVPRLQADVAVAGFPYGGVLVTPSLTFGRLADLRGLNGEENVKRLTLTAQEGDAGGPVFDNGGAVLGMMMPRQIVNGQVLPPEVSFSINAAPLLDALAAAGVAAQTTDTLAFMPPETLTSRAAESTVLVSCW